MKFTVNGRSLSLTPDEVIERVAGARPEPVQTHGVVVDGVTYPPKQAFALATGLSRHEFTTETARRQLGRLGFTVLRSAEVGQSGLVVPESDGADAHAWPWEGAVQSTFIAWLQGHGWSVLSEADTATKAHGIDVVAGNGERILGAEVKGWPSIGYADERRFGEVKRTRPTTQAGHWFSQALMKAIMLLDSHPDHESLVVVPDYPRYRDLAARTARGRAAAGVHVVFVRSPAEATSETWEP
jgi:hypothetical protein